MPPDARAPAANPPKTVSIWLEERQCRTAVECTCFGGRDTAGSSRLYQSLAVTQGKHLNLDFFICKWDDNRTSLTGLL